MNDLILESFVRQSTMFASLVTLVYSTRFFFAHRDALNLVGGLGVAMTPISSIWMFAYAYQGILPSFAYWAFVLVTAVTWFGNSTRITAMS